ncbi:Galectin-4 [Orchesella cincta]|uniref:Galectin n=1 Tax=Orchesella cincta TaxID=48709 RepID=A0A1D2MKW1_ORCCI|nr:Galectin-4 [Orchesella cincta]
MSSPVYNPPVPYSGPIPGGFLPGRMVRVQGRVSSSSHSFAINLQSGPGPYDDVALHINPRFNENLIVRNSRIGSSWGTEERHGPPMPIAREQNFEILILAEAMSLKIAVNGQHFAEFTHRIPLERVTYLNIEGDLSISLIQFDGTVTASSAYNASAPPMGYGAGGGLPYPSSGSTLPSPGFTMPAAMPAAAAAAAYASYPGGGAPPYQQPQGQSPYGGYNPNPAQQYPPPPQQPQGGYYPQQPYPGQPGQPGPGYYQPQQPHHQGPAKSGGILGDASKLLAGGLAGVGLAKVAVSLCLSGTWDYCYRGYGGFYNKIPGLGGGGHSGGHHGYPGGGYPVGGGAHHGGGGGGGGMLGGLLGPAAALGVGGLVANKAMGGKKQKKNKLLKYGLPVGGALVGGYALKKGMKGFKHHGHGSSSSSSSSSEEE